MGSHSLHCMSAASAIGTNEKQVNYRLDLRLLFFCSVASDEVYYLPRTNPWDPPTDVPAKCDMKTITTERFLSSKHSTKHVNIRSAKEVGNDMMYDVLIIFH